MLTAPVTFISAIYMILLTIAYFTKERVSNIENKIYANMIRLSCFGIVMDAISCYMYLADLIQTPYFRMITIFMFIYYIMWSGLFLIYIMVISLKKPNMSDKDFDNKYLPFVKIIFYFYLACSFLIIFLPLNYHMENNVIFPEGLAVNLTYFIAGFVSLGTMFILLIINRKQIKSKKYVPLYALIFLLGGAAILQNLNPGLILTTAVECFITFIMYFTIENPDVQMIKELYKNKQIIEKSNDDTSKFLFRVTGDIKQPIRDIINISNDMKNMKKIDDLLESNKYINNYANQLDYLINNALNISAMDTQKIKIFENRYNIYNTFKEIEHRAKEEVHEGIEFNYTIGSSIPTYLYGDSIKLKQAITSLIRISNSFTEEGFINLDVNSLIKYNICRLVITLEDSGRGISIDRINDILSRANDEIEVIDDKDDTQNLDIFGIKKVINVLGGSLMIKSEEGKGTTVTITLDQKIVETKDTEITKKLEVYEQTLSGNKKVLLIDDDETELSKIKGWLEEEDIQVTASLFGRDAVEKIRSKAKYDFIILDDELSDINALNILEEMQKNSGFKTPVVVMINDNKEGIKLHYLKDGFADTISKSKLDTEVQRIIKRFKA